MAVQANRARRELVRVRWQRSTFCRMQVREARAADAPTIASIHVDAWRAVYRGLVGTEILNSISVTSRESRWRRIIGNVDSPSRVWVACNGDDVIGFASTAPSSDDDAPGDTAELNTLYLKPDWIGHGVGHLLLTVAVEDLASRDFSRVTLWVLSGNTHARQFYERHEWRADGATKADELGEQIRYALDLNVGSRR